MPVPSGKSVTMTDLRAASIRAARGPWISCMQHAQRAELIRSARAWSVGWQMSIG